MPELTPKHMVTILFSEGLASTMLDAYFMCVDAGEFPESDSLRSWSSRQDKVMQDEELTPREYMAKYGRQYT